MKAFVCKQLGSQSAWQNFVLVCKLHQVTDTTMAILPTQHKCGPLLKLWNKLKFVNQVTTAVNSKLFYLK